MKKEYKVKLGGKNRTFSFGLIFIGEVLDSLKLDYEEMFQVVGSNIVKYTPTMMYESLKATYDKDDKDLDFTKKDIINWLEKEEFSGYIVMQQFIVSFMQSMKNPTPIKDNEPKDEKKK